MKILIKTLFLFVSFFVFCFSASAQFGIRAGMNMTHEINSFNNQAVENAFKADNLTGYHIGVIYQGYSKSGFGLEVGALLSQKGTTFRIDTTTNVVNNVIKGYKEINNLELPLNIRYKLKLGAVAVLGIGGIYADYAINGKTVFEAATSLKTDIEKAESFDSFMDRVDYGYTYGGGIEVVKKIQLGLTWSQGLKKKDTTRPFYDPETGLSVNIQKKSVPKVFSVHLVYLF